MTLAAALGALQEYGVLMLQDSTLPSITTIVAGQPIRGSWWGNPRARGTYEVMVALEDHPDVLQTKLVDGKVTMVHRDLWPAVVAVGMSRAAWQLSALSPTATWLLSEVEQGGPLQTDLVAPPRGANKKLPEAARELERRILVHATEVHTPSGAHAKVLESWDHWRNEVAPALHMPDENAARHRLEEVVARLNCDFSGSAKLPWQARLAR